MLRLILNTPSSDLQACSGFDFAYIVLSVPRIQHWLTWIKKAKQQLLVDTDFYSTQYWNYEAHYCSAPLQGFAALFGDAWENRYENEQWNLEPECFNPPSYTEQRTECDLIKVTTSDLWWAAIPKHGDIHVTTPPIRTDDLYGFLKRLRGKHLDAGE